jgi:hypothetical protein
MMSSLFVGLVTKQSVPKSLIMSESVKFCKPSIPFNPFRMQDDSRTNPRCSLYPHAAGPTKPKPESIHWDMKENA